MTWVSRCYHVLCEWRLKYHSSWKREINKGWGGWNTPGQHLDLNTAQLSKILVQLIGMFWLQDNLDIMSSLGSCRDVKIATSINTASTIGMKKYGSWL